MKAQRILTKKTSNRCTTETHGIVGDISGLGKNIYTRVFSISIIPLELEGLNISM